MKKCNKSLVILISAVGVVVAGYVLWLSYANKKVREVVDNSILRIEQRLESSGNEVTVTYDDVKVHGMSPRPSASVYKLHVKIEDKPRVREMHVMLPEVVYTPQTFDMRSYRLEVLDSVSVMTSHRNTEEQSMIFDFSRPPALDVTQQRDGNIDYSMYVPQNITLSSAEEAEASEAKKMDITFESEPQVRWSENAQGVSLSQIAIFPHTILTQNGQQKAELDNFSAETRHSLLADGQLSYETLIKMDNLVFTDEELKVLNPISVVNEVVYTGPAITGEEATNEPMHVNIRNIAWMTGLMSIFANGEVHFVPAEEKMPYGELALRINNLDRFLSYVSEQHPNAADYMQKLRASIEKLSGEVIEQGGEVKVKLVREPKGRLLVGALTLEEALTLFIGMAMEMPDMSLPQKPAVTEEEEIGEEAVDGVEEEVPADATNEAVEEVAPAAEEPVAPAVEAETGKEAEDEAPAATEAAPTEEPVEPAAEEAAPQAPKAAEEPVAAPEAPVEAAPVN